MTIDELRRRSVEIIRDGQHASGGYVASPTFPQYAYSLAARRLLHRRRDEPRRRTRERRGVLRLGRAHRRVGQGLRRALHARRRARPGDVAAPPERRLGAVALGDARAHAAGTAAASRWAAAARTTAAELERVRLDPCVDWWEEREGVHAATLACIAAGLGDELDLSPAEERLDGSLLVLPFLGFGAVDVSPLVSPGGGVHRHLDDVYYGGGEWLLLTALLGLAEPATAAATASTGSPRTPTPDGELPGAVAGPPPPPRDAAAVDRAVGPARLAAPLVARDVPHPRARGRRLMPARLQLIARTGHPDFLDLPWDEPLAEWESERLVEVVRGIHRHVVRFVEYDAAPGPALYALKELPAPHRAPRVQPAAEPRGGRDAGRRGGRRRQRPRHRERRRARSGADHAAPRLLAAVPHALRARQRPRPAPAAARRGCRAARPAPPRRLLLGRLLALEHALPPRRRRARRLPRRRRDRRAPPQPLRRAARARPPDRGGERRRRARGRRGGARPRGGARAGGDRRRARRALRRRSGTS